MYSTEQIKEFVKILEDSQLAVMELTDESGSIRLEKPNKNYDEYVERVAVSPVAVESPTVTATTAVNVASAPETPVQTIPSRTINSPMVGVFYAAPNPDSEPYVTVGKRVIKGEVVCIVEAMKIMNEITAEESGTVTEILVSNGDVVEYGQPLFKVE